MEIRPGTWDWYGRFGRYYFPDNNERREAIIEKLRNNDREDRVFLLLRPATKPPGPIAKKIIGPDGEPSLIIYDCRM